MEEVKPRKQKTTLPFRLAAVPVRVDWRPTFRLEGNQPIPIVPPFNSSVSPDRHCHPPATDEEVRRASLSTVRVSAGGENGRGI